MRIQNYIFALFIIFFAGACSSPRVATVDENQKFHRSSVNTDSILSHIPDYETSLQAIDGKGKAIVSEPGNTERVTVYFKGDQKKSLVTVKNALGIEGGQFLAEGDSLLIYNKVDNVAHKISVHNDRMSSVQHLASINILQMLNFAPEPDQVTRVYESQDRFLLLLDTGAEVVVNKEDFNVRRVDQPRSTRLPYSRIIYEAYGSIEGFILPRRVTIFSADGQSKIALLIQSLEVNPGDLELEIDLPNDVKFVSQ